MPKRKLRKVVAVGLALFMTAGVDNGWAIGNIAKGITVQAKSIAKAEEGKKENPANVLEYDNKIEPDFRTRYIVQISRDKDFPDGYGAYVTAMDKRDTTDYIKQLNKSLKESNMEVEDMVNPVDISVSNETNEDVENTGKVKVRLFMENTDGLGEYDLYHFKKDGTQEKVSYTLGRDITKTESEYASYAEFETESFSPFIFVKTRKIEADKAPVVTPKKSKVKTESANKEESEATAEEASDENQIATAANGQPSIYFRTLKTEMFNGGTKNADGSYTWTPKSKAKGHQYAFRISYSISGVDTAKAGSMKLTIPRTTIVDRNGAEADEAQFSIPTKAEADAYLAGQGEEFDADVNFAYYVEGDNIVIYNFRDISAGDNGYIEMAYATTKTTFNYKDKQQYTFRCSGEITDDNGNKSSMSTENIKFDMDSSATLDRLNIVYPDKYSTWQSSWGTSIKPANADDYLYLQYRVETRITATQPYTFTIDNKVTGLDDNMTNAMKIIGYKFSGKGWQKENSVQNQTLYSANKGEDARYDYVLLRIKRSEINKVTYWKAMNQFTVTLSPTDKIDDNSVLNQGETWHWHKPIFYAPGGSANVYHRGDGVHRQNDPHSIYYDAPHWTSSCSLKVGDYSRYDLEAFNGYDGEKITMTSMDGLDFGSWFVAYGYRYTYDYDNYNVNAKDPKGYGKKDVRYELVNNGVYLYDALQDNPQAVRTPILTYNDYCYSKIDFDTDFSDAVFNEEEQRFDRIDSATYGENESLDFYGKFKDSKKDVLFAKYNLKTGTVWFDSNYVASMNNRTIQMKDGADLVEYTVKTANKHYRSEVFTVPNITLKNSKTVMDFVKNKKEVAVHAQSKVYIYASSTVYKDDIEKGDEGKAGLVFSEKSSDDDFVRTTKRDSSISKEVVSTTNNTKKKYYRLSWAVKAKETAQISAEEKLYIPQSSGTLFDLIPKGATLDKNSIRVKNGDNYLSSSEYKISTIQDYKGTGRTMLVVKILSGAQWYELDYDTLYTWDSINDYGNNVYNPVAYKTGNDTISNGFKDNGGKAFIDGTANPDVIQDADLMSGLDDIDLDSAKTGNEKKYIFGEDTVDLLTLTAASSGLKKKVKDEREAEYTYTSETTLGGSYSYQLRYQSSNGSSSKDMIFFDSLENYDQSTMTNAGTESQWHGTLTGVGTKQLEEKGISPVVYISTVPNLDIDAHHDLTDKAVWTKVTSKTDLSTAKAVAIDMTRAKDGSEYELPQRQSVVAYLYMKAPASTPDTGKKALPYAYNNVYIQSRITDMDTNSSDRFLIHQDFTKVSLPVTGSFGLRKVSSESENVRISDVTFRLTGTSAYGTEYNQSVKTNQNGELYFNDIEMGTYVLQEQEVSNDWLLDTTEHTVQITNEGKVLIDNQEYTDRYVMIANHPRVHTDVTFYKTNASNSYIKVKGSQFMLSGTSDYGTTIKNYAVSNDNGRVVFKDIEMGTYELKESRASEGYALNQNVYQVKVDDSGHFMITLKSSNGLSIDVQKQGSKFLIGNEPLHSVVFYKASSWDNSTLSEAKFTLKGTSNSGKAVNAEAFSDKNGKVEFSGLEAGLYTLKEVTAPAGYDLDPASYTVQVKTILEGETGEAVIINGLEKNEKILGGKVFVFYNNAKAGKMSVTKVWDDGEEDRDPASLNIVLTTDKPSQYYASHTITFDANGGNFGSTDKNQVLYGVSKTGQIQTVISGSVLLPSKDGFKFDYWDKTSTAKSYWTTNKDGTGTKYFSIQDDTTHIVDEDGNIPDLKQDMVLYANYEEVSYTLEFGLKFQNHIPDNATSVVFTDEEAPDGATLTDVSEKKNGAVVGWLEGTTWKVSSQKAGQKIQFNEDCYGMFKCSDSVYVYTFVDGKFYYPKNINITSILFSDFIDTSKTTDMRHMFADYKGSELDVSHFDTSNVMHMKSMFSDCKALVTLDVSHFDTSKVTTLANMFNGCESLASLDVSHFDTSKVTDMSNMFQRCESLATVNVSNWNTNNVTNMQNMFYGCNALTTLDVSNWNTSNVTAMSLMFYNCSSLTTLDVSHFDTSKVIILANMFNGCKHLASLDVSHFDTSKVTDMSNMFQSCKSLATVNVSNWNTNNVTNMQNMFYGCNALTTLDVSNWNTSNVTNMEYMFFDCNTLTTLDVSNWNTSNVTNMYFMFGGCDALATLDVSNWNTSNVTTMSLMFHNCSSLTTLDVSHFDTSKVTDMSNMFSGCDALTSLDVSHFDTSNVTDMNAMFDDCASLVSLDVSNWNTSNVTNMISMFNVCSNLTTLDVSHFDMGNVTNMSFMFNACSNLTALDVSQFNTSNVIDMRCMFFSCYKLSIILIGPEWTTQNVQNGDGMFRGSNLLPNYDSAVTDKSKAHADEGGYMTFNSKFNVPYTVHFEKNNSTVTGNMNDESFLAGEKKALSKNMFKDTTNRYTFLSWNTKADGSGRSFTDEQVVQYLTKDSSITLYAQWKDAFVKYSHTANINDEGVASGTYASNLATTDTVKIDGAKKLKVEVWVSTESVSYDWLELRDVNGTKLTKDANGAAIGSSGKLGGGRSSQKPSNSQVFYITGDTVQFYFKSDSSGNYYGYYAIVTQAE